MWNRQELKSNARQALKHQYIKSFLVCILAVACSFICNLLQKQAKKGLQTPSKEVFIQNDKNLINIRSGGTSVRCSLVIAAILYAVFIMQPLMVGKNRFFVQNKCGAGKFSATISVFSGGYTNVVRTMLITHVITRVWALLFIVPGVVKVLEYYFVPYILSDNPEISQERARKISSNMTKGHKKDILMLNLSFSGWILLMGFLGGGAVAVASWAMGMPICWQSDWWRAAIGALIFALSVLPYIQATSAELYIRIREKFIAEGQISGSEIKRAVYENF